MPDTASRFVPYIRYKDSDGTIVRLEGGDPEYIDTGEELIPFPVAVEMGYVARWILTSDGLVLDA